jgi:hypothetical protein
MIWIGAQRFVTAVARIGILVAILGAYRVLEGGSLTIESEHAP